MENEITAHETAPPIVAVAGSTGWLGNYVFDCILQQHHYSVRALLRPSSCVPAKDESAMYQVHRGDVTDASSLLGLATDAVALISCVGVRDLAVPNKDIQSVLTDGTLNLWEEAKRAKVRTFVTIAGGIHKTAGGQVNREMIHNAAREAALDNIQEEIQSASESALRLPSVVVVDASVFFKDAAQIFDMIVSANPPSLRLVAGSWAVNCNPISGRDLADRLVRSCGIVNLSDKMAPPVSALPTFKRKTAGGADIVALAELADAAGDAMGFDTSVRKQSIPQPLAWFLLLVTKALAALGSTKALKVMRFLSFLWVIGTDASPCGLVGDVDGSRDGVLSYYQELAKQKKGAKEATS